MEQGLPALPPCSRHMQWVRMLPSSSFPPPQLHFTIRAGGGVCCVPAAASGLTLFHVLTLLWDAHWCAGACRERPCKRCGALGRPDHCVNVERKKRGRPRKNPIEGEELLEKRARINEGERLPSVRLHLPLLPFLLCVSKAHFTLPACVEQNTRREQMVMAEPTAATLRRFIPLFRAFHSSSRPITRCSLNRRLLQTRLTRRRRLPLRPLLPLLPSTWRTTSSLLASPPRGATATNTTTTTTTTTAGITATTASTETTAAAAAGTRTVTDAAERMMARKSRRTSEC